MLDLGNKLEGLNPISPLLSQSEGRIETFKNFNSSLSLLSLSAFDAEGFHTKDFGLEKCISSAERIFTPDALGNWGELPIETRERMTRDYANEVASNFELKCWRGLYFEPMEPGVMGYNNGDGTIHLSDTLIKDGRYSPMELIDTITHELRHQYQTEAMQGLHNVREDTRMAWIKGANEYTTAYPSSLDPIGYKYNPLEIDARQAATTVIDGIYKDYANESFKISNRI